MKIIKLVIATLWISVSFANARESFKAEHVLTFAGFGRVARIDTPWFSIIKNSVHFIMFDQPAVLPEKIIKNIP